MDLWARTSKAVPMATLELLSEPVPSALEPSVELPTVPESARLAVLVVTTPMLPTPTESMVSTETTESTESTASRGLLRPTPTPRKDTSAPLRRTLTEEVSFGGLYVQAQLTPSAIVQGP